MRAYSLDMREKIVTAYEQGKTSIRKIAERFLVSPGVVQRLLNQKRTLNSLAPLKATGGKRSQLEDYKLQIIEIVAKYPDLTLEEYCEYCEEKTGVRVSISTMCRFLKKENLSLKKKTWRSTQAQTEEKQLLRVEYWQKIRDVDPSNLVFLDESGAHLGLNRTKGRSLRGQRAYDKKPFYHGQKITMIGAITMNGILAIQTLAHSLKGEDFRSFVKEQLLPKLWRSCSCGYGQSTCT